MSDRPIRIQRRRDAGWRMPAGAVYVGRPTRFGNPFAIDGVAAPLAAIAAGGRADVRRDLAHGVVCLYVRWLGGLPVECVFTAAMARAEMAQRGNPAPPAPAEIAAALRGKALACWCPLDQPCHADVLLAFANR